jgi:hypothetical protein
MQPIERVTVMKRQRDHFGSVHDRDRQDCEAVVRNRCVHERPKGSARLSLLMPTLIAISQYVPMLRSNSLAGSEGAVPFHVVPEIIERRVEVIGHVENLAAGAAGLARFPRRWPFGDQRRDRLLVADDHEFLAGGETVDEVWEVRLGLLDSDA